MPPKRGGPRTRAVHHHAPTIQSDYDTDAATMTESAATPAPVPRRTVDELNMLALTRIDPSVTSIENVANFTVVYTFTAAGEWEKCGIEGTLFVCKLTPDILPDAPLSPVQRYRVIITNRKALGMDFSADLLAVDAIEITEDFVIVSTGETGDDGTQKVWGLWIYSEPPPSSTADTRRKTAEKMVECAILAERSRDAAKEEAMLAQQQHQHAQPQIYHQQEPQQPFHQPPQFYQHNQQYPPHPQSDPAHFYNQMPPMFPPQHQHQLHQQQQQRDVIGDLFRNAKHGY